MKFSELMPVEEAKIIIKERVSPLQGMERVGLGDAVNRVLAEDARGDMDIPPFDRCNMDGFAVISLEGAGEFEALEIVQAGNFPRFPVRQGKVAKVMTGAPLPQGADAVVPIEKTLERENGKVCIPEKIKPGENITPRGLELKKGDLILGQGTFLRAQEISMLASVGCPRPFVYLLPTVAIFSTGSELLEPEEPPNPAKIRNSNSYGLMAQCRSMGIQPTYLGIVHDDRQKIREKILEGLKKDVLLLTGGMSVGDFDFVPDLLRELGVTFWFEGVRIKPGKPVHFGTTEDSRVVFGLPGNPVSTMVIFEQFVKPALKILMRLPSHDEVEKEKGVLKSEFRRRDSSREEYLPVFAQREGDGFAIQLISYHGSGHMMALTKANALMQIHVGIDTVPPGAVCEFRWLG